MPKKLVDSLSTVRKKQTQVSPKCKDFCVEVLMPKFKKQFISTLDKKVKPQKKSVLDNEYKDCLRYYCNPTCKNDLFVKPQHKEKGEINFTKKQISILKSKGAVSACPQRR